MPNPINPTHTPLKRKNPREEPPWELIPEREDDAMTLLRIDVLLHGNAQGQLRYGYELSQSDGYQYGEDFDSVHGALGDAMGRITRPRRFVPQRETRHFG